MPWNELSFAQLFWPCLQSKQLTLTQKSDALDLYVRDGWLSHTPGKSGYYSLGVCRSSQCPNFRGSSAYLAYLHAKLSWCFDWLPTLPSMSSFTWGGGLPEVWEYTSKVEWVKDLLIGQIQIYFSIFYRSDLSIFQVRTFLELHDMLLNLPLPDETRRQWEAFLWCKSVGSARHSQLHCFKHTRV